MGAVHDVQAPPRAALRGPMRVLLAEDEALAAAALEGCLAEEGFVVTVATDGLAALEAAARVDYDVLLTDLRMPRLDGAALIRRLRESRPELPVVVMTGQAAPDWRTVLQRDGEGPIVLLHKPISLRAIVGALRGVTGPGAR